MSWRIPAGQVLRIHTWQDECVVFNDLSGDTHLLGSAAATVLAALNSSPADSGQLAALLADAYCLPLDAQLAEDVDDLLSELAGFFLIEPFVPADMPC